MDRETLERAAKFFETDGWRGMIWTREAIAKQLRRMGERDEPARPCTEKA